MNEARDEKDCMKLIKDEEGKERENARQRSSFRKGAVIKAGEEGNAANWEINEEEVKGNSSTSQIR